MSVSAVVARVLEESDLFSDLGEAQRARIAGFSREAEFNPGDALLRVGDPAGELFIVAKGRAAVEVGLAGRQRRRCATVIVAGPGETVGWSAGLGAPNYLASANAVEKTVAVAIEGGALRRLFDEEPAMGLDVTRKLAGIARSRLCRTIEVLAAMLSTASHDLKSPLAAIQSFHSVIVGGFAGEINEQQKNMLLRAGERIKGMVSHIDAMFDPSCLRAREELQFGEVSPVELAQTSLDSIRAGAAEKGIDLSAEFALGLPMCRADAGRLRQAVTSLLANAVKFTGEGGLVTLKICGGAHGDIVFEVADNGPGIAADELPRIFDDFYRGRDAPAGGPGVGLSNARRIIEAHGGRIWAESPCPESDKGARFIFTLPGR